MRVAALTAALITALVATQPYVTTGAAPVQGTLGSAAEIQIGLCAPVEHIVQALELHPRGEPITVWQFDDDSLSLLQRGIRLRLRVAADGRSELTLKVADQDCVHLDPKRVPEGQGKCEYDLYGGSVSGAVSLTRSLSAFDTQGLLAGRSTPTQVLSRSQATYLRKVVRFWPLAPELRRLGPMQVQRYRTKGDVYDIDISRLPADERYAEISRKVPLADADRAMAILEDYLQKARVATCVDQSSPAAEKLRALTR